MNWCSVSRLLISDRANEFAVTNSVPLMVGILGGVIAGNPLGGVVVGSCHGCLSLEACPVCGVTILVVWCPGEINSLVCVTELVIDDAGDWESKAELVTTVVVAAPPGGLRFVATLLVVVGSRLILLMMECMFSSNLDGRGSLSTSSLLASL